MNAKQLAEKARDIRADIVTSIHAAGSGHPGGSLSAVEMVTVLYFDEMNVDPANPQDPQRDRFVLSRATGLRFSTAPWRKRASFPRRTCLLCESWEAPCRDTRT